MFNGGPYLAGDGYGTLSKVMVVTEGIFHEVRIPPRGRISYGSLQTQVLCWERKIYPTTPSMGKGGWGIRES